MKKLVTLLAAAGMVMAASAPASAVDVKVDARYRVSFKTGETGFTGANQEMAQHRLRLGLTMAASENLKGYFQLQSGKDVWGTTDSTAGHKNGKNLSVRQVYVDWTVPATPIKVRMGRWDLGLPGDAFGNNAVISGGWGTKDGMIVTAPVTDWLGLTALWSRIGSDGGTDLDDNLTDDVFALVANMKFPGISGSVYAAYAALDGAHTDSEVWSEKHDATNKCPGAGDHWHPTTSYPAGVKNDPAGGVNFDIERGNAWWVGFTSTMSYFDPFVLKFSAAYGSFESSVDPDNETAGWNVQAKASYKMDFGTPVLGAWYFSGMDKDGDGLMPSVGGYFTPTRTWNDASKGLTGGQCLGLPTGNWGVQLGVEQVSFLQNLSHDFLVSYIKGTNDKEAFDDEIGEALVLSEEDSLVEFDFISTYQIYKNLAAHLELSYIISDFEDSKTTKTTLTEDDWRAELTFEYKF